MRGLASPPILAISVALIVSAGGLGLVELTSHSSSTYSASLTVPSAGFANYSAPTNGAHTGVGSHGPLAGASPSALVSQACQSQCLHHELTHSQVNSSTAGWVQLRPTSSPPLNVSEYDQGAYDSADNSTVLFHSLCSYGPCNAPSTWVFHSGNWSMAQSSPPPGPRALPTLVYDSLDRATILYGGQTWSSTWEFSHGNWTNVTKGAAPNPMEGVGLAYDAFDKYVLLFGGTNTTGSGIPNETWTFARGNWTPIATQGQAPPDYGEYQINPMVYDSALDSVVLFENTNWTYLYQEGTWTAVYAPIPYSLEAGGGSLVYDDQIGEVICMGGYQGGAYTNQTWAFNGTGWSLLHPTEAPPVSFNSVLVSDSMDGNVLFYGGGTFGGGGNNQTWIFGAANISFVAVPVGGGNFSVGGKAYPGGGPAWVPFGIYQPKLIPDPGFHGLNISVSGNFTPYNGSYRLTGNATVVGQFVAFPRVSLAALPSTCEVEFNNTLYSSGSSAPFVPGSYSLIAPACPQLVFKTWLSGVNASILNVYSNHTTVTLSGPSTLTAEFLATVTFEVNPSFSGTIYFNGIPQVPDASQDRPTQNYSLDALAAPGWRLADFSATGGIQLAPGAAEVGASGVIVASFVQFPIVALGTSLASCRTVLFNGSSYPSVSDLGFLPGNYTAEAPVCSDALFEHWNASGGVTVASPESINTTANVTGNGTLTADYGAAAWVNVSAQPSAAAGSIIWNGTPVRNGSSFETLTGDYVATAYSANGWHFLAWETRGGIKLIPGSFSLSSNASLTADFQVNATSPGGNQSGAGPFVRTVWEWAALGIAATVIAAAALLVFVRRRKATEPKTQLQQP